MILKKEYVPQFRETDADGKIGLRGYMDYFQDVATTYMYNLGKSNDTLPEEYGLCWMYTRYKIHINKKADFNVPLKLETWVEKSKSSFLVFQDMVISRNGEVYASGRLENCLYNRKLGEMGNVNEVDFPLDVALDKKVEIGTYTRFRRKIDDMKYCYSHTVRYTDMDKNIHMNNLVYISLMMDAFNYEFYCHHRITDFEIHYISQCFEGEEIKLYMKQDEQGYKIAFVKADGTLAAIGLIKVEDINN